MSINCVNVADSDLLRKASYNGKPNYVHATLDPPYVAGFPFPIDYKFKPCFLPRKYSKMADRVDNFKVRPDDIFVVTFPKAGTTWCINIVSQLMNGLDFSSAVFKPVTNYLENAILYEPFGNSLEMKKNVELLDKKIDEYANMPSPRIIKSHLPAQLLPKEIWSVRPKIIYVAREPKDVAVSLFYMLRNTSGLYPYSLNDFLETFLNDHVMYAPFHNHVLDFWKLRSLENVFFTTYEKMSDNCLDVVSQLSDFLGFSYNDKQLKDLADYVSFDNLREKLGKPDKLFSGEKHMDPDFR